jgi:Co/Zn/Cd efflux system component
MKLDSISNVQSLKFDIRERSLSVYHKGDYQEILASLDELKLDTKYDKTEQTEEIIIEDNCKEKSLLWQVLLINLFFFLLESVTGFLSNSMGLVADGMDMLADTMVYGLGLIAVGGSVTKKKNIAKISGYFQFALAIFGFGEVVRRFLGYEETPNFEIMISISVLALIGNSICLYLLNKSTNQEAHMKASMIFTSNDVIANIGVIVAGVLVLWTDSKYPDLIIGTLVLGLVVQGAYRILQIAK